MRAIHVNWTKPFFERHRLRGHGAEITRLLNSSTYDQPDYQVMYTILSALHWKKLHGPIKLYTDTVGLSFYREIGIDIMYDEIDVDFLNAYSKSKVDPAYFWTSGKVKCLAHQTTPFVFLDQDLIIRAPILPDLFKGDLTITHWEIPRGYYYFEKEDWEKEVTHIPFPKNYNTADWSPNTSFLYFGNMELLREYHEWHKKLVTTGGAKIPEWFWLLTDQGILGHVVREGDYRVKSLTDLVYLADSSYGTTEYRHKGKSEAWYYPIGSDMEKDNKMSWEHVWLNKVHFSYVEGLLEKTVNRYFKEIIDLGYETLLYHPRFKPYWDKYYKYSN